MFDTNLLFFLCRYRKKNDTTRTESAAIPPRIPPTMVPVEADFAPLWEEPLLVVFGVEEDVEEDGGEDEGERVPAGAEPWIF
jgi:hypothetical protein